MSDRKGVRVKRSYEDIPPSRFERAAKRAGWHFSRTSGNQMVFTHTKSGEEFEAFDWVDLCCLSDIRP